MTMKYQCHTALLVIQLLRTIHHRQKLTARRRETEFQMSWRLNSLLTKRSLIWVQAVSMIARNVLILSILSFSLLVNGVGTNFRVGGRRGEARKAQSGEMGFLGRGQTAPPTNKGFAGAL